MHWVTIRKFMDETGLSYSATRRRRQNNILRSVYVDGRWWIDIDAFTDRIEEESRLEREKVIHFPKKTVDLKEYIKNERDKYRKAGHERGERGFTWKIMSKL